MPRLSLHASQKTNDTPAGQIPVDWGCVPFKDVVRDATYGLSLPTDPNGNVPILKMNAILDGKLSVEDLDKVTCDAAELSRYSIQRGDILFNRTNSYDLVGKTAVVKEDARIVFASYLVRYKINDAALPEFVTYWFNYERVQKRLKELATVGVSQSNINPTRLQKDLFVALPPLPEQQKIANVLGTWDEALEKHDALIAAKDRRKQALTQQLLSGRSTKKKWPRVSLSEVAEACSIRNGEKLERTRLYAVTKAEGMVPMRENVQGATINRCQIVERGWFAYNPMRINIGSIARWEHDDPVMVSPDYVVFKTDETRLLSDYLNHVRRGIAWSDFVGAAGNGSVRVRIWFEDLGCFKFPLPSIPEQRAIANILDAADAELRLLRQQRAALDHQKRGLMQQLLTGRIRVSL